MDKNNYIKYALQSLDNIEINVSKTGFLTGDDALKLITLCKNTIKNYGNNLDAGDRQSVIDLLNIILNIIFAVEENNFERVKKVIEQYGYVGKKEFVFKMIDKIYRLGD